MEKIRPRDLLLYKQTDALENILLDNTRDERQKEVDRMKTLRLMNAGTRGSRSNGGTFSPMSHSLNVLSQHLSGRELREVTQE